MTQPTTRTTFKDYCKRKLGWPVVELNIDDDQVEDCIDDSLNISKNIILMQPKTHI